MLLAELAMKHRLPSMFGYKASVVAGGLMSYSPNYVEVTRLAATYIDKILKGAKPADLPVEQATRFELVINMKTAKALGLTIPPTLLAFANEVIDELRSRAVFTCPAVPPSSPIRRYRYSERHDTVTVVFLSQTVRRRCICFRIRVRRRRRLCRFRREPLPERFDLADSAVSAASAAALWRERWRS